MLNKKTLKKILNLRVLGLKKASNLTFLKSVKTKIFIFEYFPKISSKINFIYPFYPILIPNTPYVNFSLFFFMVLGGYQKSKIIFYDI